MSIVESGNPRRIRRITTLEGIAGGAIVAAAVFAAAPKFASAQSIQMQVTGGTTTDPTAAGALTWFNTSNWNNAGVTGSLPESDTASPTAQNIAPDNATMPSVGLVFDPGNDPNTPGGPNGSYVANLDEISGSTYVSSVAGTYAAPAKLTIESGTLVMGTVTVGRDSTGIIALNGGAFLTVGSIKIQGTNKVATAIGTGTFEYHGGTLDAEQGIQLGSGACSTGLTRTSAGVGYFTVYSDGPAGAILSQNGFQFATNTSMKGTIGIVEFHLDTNSRNPGTTPIQGNVNQGNAESGQGVLHIQNNTNVSSRLNLVLDDSPGTIVAAGPDAGYVNLGLFDETVIAGSGTYPKAFYSVDGSTVFTQGATISATFGSSTYSWTISYSGQINFTNTATSSYTSADISATGGNDVVLIGLTPVLVPEPTSMALLGGAGAMILARRRRKADKAKQA